MQKTDDFLSNILELKSVNRVRMAHKVDNLSDIATTDGIKLDTNYLISKEYTG